MIQYNYMIIIFYTLYYDTNIIRSIVLYHLRIYIYIYILSHKEVSRNHGKSRSPADSEIFHRAEVEDRSHV